eukprot:642157-Alexandrium_andersonii.AAC.1
MSASLVGSEMCIRDRSRACCWGGSGEASRTAAPGQQRSKPLETAISASSCLLYTSDAADDM